MDKSQLACPTFESDVFPGRVRKAAVSINSNIVLGMTICTSEKTSHHKRQVRQLARHHCCKEFPKILANILQINN